MRTWFPLSMVSLALAGPAAGPAVAQGVPTVVIDLNAEAIRKLQAAGLIQYRRGQITVTDRPGLEARVCECYGVVKKEYDRLLPTGVAR